MRNRSRCSLTITIVFLCAAQGEPAFARPFRVLPYLQNPTTDGVTVRWFSDSEMPGELTVETPEGPRVVKSEARRAEALAFNPWAPEPGGPHPAPPYRHTARVDGLSAGTRYRYVVTQSGESRAAEFKTAPSSDRPVRFIVYSDSETEPESSTSPPVDWPASTRSNRPEGVKLYVADQTAGYRENLKVIAARDPDFIALPGDLVETGGEQRDWDEFWRHNAGEYGTLASRTPIFAALGNHENFAGPGGGYSAEGADFATAKFLEYFETPSNRAFNPRHRGRYHRVDYGPITLITLDSSNGFPQATAADTNHNLSGSYAPDFNPGSDQYAWFEAQLADAQKRCRFTFVQFHHTAYGSGPHSVPFGRAGFSGQSGIAMRVLLPLLTRYGVDAVFSGHDEMLERSAVEGTEIRPDGTNRPHTVHFYDVGIGGDGLRGPSAGYDNPHRRFLAHEDEPEIWEGKRLVSGGKHYGHVEVNVARGADGRWRAEIVPVHVFPKQDGEGRLTGWERRPLKDVVTLTPDPEEPRAGARHGAPSTNAAAAVAMVIVAVLGGGPWRRRRADAARGVATSGA